MRGENLLRGDKPVSVGAGRRTWLGVGSTRRLPLTTLRMVRVGRRGRSQERKQRKERAPPHGGPDGEACATRRPPCGLPRRPCRLLLLPHIRCLLCSACCGRKKHRPPTHPPTPHPHPSPPGVMQLKWMGAPLAYVATVAVGVGLYHTAAEVGAAGSLHPAQADGAAAASACCWSWSGMIGMPAAWGVGCTLIAAVHARRPAGHAARPASLAVAQQFSVPCPDCRHPSLGACFCSTAWSQRSSRRSRTTPSSASPTLRWPTCWCCSECPRCACCVCCARCACCVALERARIERVRLSSLRCAAALLASCPPPALLAPRAQRCRAPGPPFNFFISIVLGRRTNTAYQRFDEARKMWGLIVNRSRDMTRQARQCRQSLPVLHARGCSPSPFAQAPWHACTCWVAQPKMGV